MCLLEMSLMDQCMQLSESSLSRKWPAVLANDQEFQSVSCSLKGILDLTDSWCVWLLYLSQMLNLWYIYHIYSLN